MAITSITESDHCAIIRAWDILESCGVAAQTIEICTSVYGLNMRTMEEILFCVTGYRDFDDFEICECAEF